MNSDEHAVSEGDGDRQGQETVGGSTLGKLAIGALVAFMLLAVGLGIWNAMKGSRNPNSQSSAHEAAVAQLEDNIEIAKKQKELREITGQPASVPACGLRTGPSGGYVSPAPLPAEKVEVVNLELGKETVVLVKAELGGYTPYIRIPAGMTVDGVTIPGDALPPIKDSYVFPNGTTLGPKNEILRRYSTGAGYVGAPPLEGVRVTLTRIAE